MFSSSFCLLEPLYSPPIAAPTNLFLSAAVKSSGHMTVNVPKEIDREVALRKISYWGLEIDRLTPEQEKYLGSWEV